MLWDNILGSDKMKRRVPKYTPSENNQYFYRDSEMFRATMETDDEAEINTEKNRK